MDQLVARFYMTSAESNLIIGETTVWRLRGIDTFKVIHERQDTEIRTQTHDCRTIAEALSLAAELNAWSVRVTGRRY